MGLRPWWELFFLRCQDQSHTQGTRTLQTPKPCEATAGECIELTANDSSVFSPKLTFRPDNTFTEEGVWAGRRCRAGRRGAAAAPPQPSVRYRIEGTYRDHGPDPRVKGGGGRKLILELREATVSPLPGTPEAAEAWRAACPCNGRAWQPLEEVDVLARCAGSCEPFGYRMALQVVSLTDSPGKLCLSHRRSFDERWPAKHTLGVCLEKLADMSCDWKPPKERVSMSAKSLPASAAFSSLRLPAEDVAGMPLAVLRASVSLGEEGSYVEEVDWSLGKPQGSGGPHFRTVARGQWHHHGEHPFYPGRAQLRAELRSVHLTLGETPVCLEEGCAPPGLLLRLACPCGDGAWVAGQGPVEVMRCPDPGCALAPFFPGEAFFMGGGRDDGELCLSARQSLRFAGWGLNGTDLWACSGTGQRPRAGAEQARASGTTEPPPARPRARGGFTTTEPPSERPRRAAQKPTLLWEEPEAAGEEDADAARQKADRAERLKGLREEANAARLREMRQKARASADGGAAGGAGPGSDARRMAIYAEPGFAGPRVEVEPGKHTAVKMGLERVGSIRVPPGWRVSVLAPLTGRGGKSLGGDQNNYISAQRPHHK